VAAVCYLVAEELDRNPFLLLRLRGLGRGDVAAVAAAGGAPGDATEEQDAPPPGNRTEGRDAGGVDGAVTISGGGQPSEPHPITEDPERFWGSAGSLQNAGAEEPTEGGRANGDEPEAAHLRLLGRVPFWRGETDPEAVLAEMVRRAEALGTEVLAGESSEDPEDAGTGNAGEAR
jgi:uncharacterized Zn finger protein